MALWKVEPTWKKSIIERQYWSKEGIGTVMQEVGWRWGEFVIETEDDNPPEIEEGVDIMNCDYQLIDFSTWDGCWEDKEYYIDDEKERENIEMFLEENSAYELEDDGWECTDSEMIIDCELKIEKVEDN